MSGVWCALSNLLVWNMVFSLHVATGQCVPAVALAFRAQLVGEVPVAPNDRDVDIIVTADSQILCSERARMLRSAGD